MKSAFIALERRPDFIDDHIVGVFTKLGSAKSACNNRSSFQVDWRVAYDRDTKTMSLHGASIANGTKFIIRRFELNR